MTLKITLVGRSNVGKSSIFNFLTRENSSLVSDTVQTTRDRNYGFFFLKNRQFCIIDTSGIEYVERKEFIQIESYKQTKIAVRESNFLIFVVDAYTGINNLDFFILEKIRKTNKPIFLLINKIDRENLHSNIIDFYDFGIKTICKISILHRIGISDFFKKIWTFYKKFFKNDYNQKILYDSSQPKVCVSICFLGKPNSGKSSIINGLLNKNRMITSSIPGTTRDIIKDSLYIKNIEYIFTDTAGIKKTNKKNTFLEYLSEKNSIKSIQLNQIVGIVIDSSIGVCAQDLSIINSTIKSGKSFFIVLNKWDLIPPHQKTKIKNFIYNRLQFIKNISIIYVSALYKIGLNKILNQINIIYKESLKNFSTSYLTRILNKAVLQHPLPSGITGKVIRLKYAHFGNKNPIFIIIHGTQIQYIPLTYKKYLMHFFQRNLQIQNTPIKLFFKNSVNPYIHKKN
ncbi:ribosome biogenesis GTPase Der [Buchnera aphidicola]|uniref:GTPase Der n=1 Tax=Buchnera aphidicola (Cinara cf. splendens/pseudotsugae 3390) TaxID=2518980 RepID=A0A451CY82_9GAMM|nr:ribosome biogenesis GTPase Der [Buchnera aphidicola]VFP77980.1 GTPase Der [Buchnera aphidicola (Cinara cf. splendens/pseudotsugae 3390)]